MHPPPQRRAQANATRPSFVVVPYTRRALGALRELELVEAGEALRQRRALRLVERDLQRRQSEHRALEAHRRERDADLLEQLVLVERRHLGGGAALHHLRQHRGRGLRDGAAATGELHLVDRLAVVAERDVDGDLVAAERVLPLRLRIGVLEDAVPARVLVVVEDDLAIHLLELVHANTLRTVCRPSTSWSISSRSVYR